jgi:two-component system, chemotaxis family, chemotaxis protein CheY
MAGDDTQLKFSIPKPGRYMPIKKIMVVDDSGTLREAVGTELRTAGYEVSEAADGRAGLEMLNRERFDLVICDVLMPVMDGIAFVKEVRKRPDCRYLPIVMLTTEAGEKRRQQGQMAGATAWVVKPFRPEQILRVVSKLVMR